MIKIKWTFVFYLIGLHLGVSAQVTLSTEGFNDSLRYLKRRVYSTDNPKRSTLDKLVDTTLLSYMQSPQNCGMSIGIMKDGLKYFYNYGEVKRDSKKRPDNSTVYELGAISTTFCGLLLAAAIQDGKLKVEDDIRKYLPVKYPELIYYKSPIRIKHLVNHTSGLPAVPENMGLQTNYDSLNPYKHYTREQLFEYLKVVKLKQEPGSVCNYSNLGMALLGMILEGIYAKSFEELVKEKICVPLKMEHTFVNPTYIQKDFVAQGYNEEGESTPAWDLGVFDAAGGMRSSAEDLLCYLDYQLSEKDAAVKMSHQPSFIGRESLGFAWFIKRTKSGNTLYWHNGATFGFRSFCGFIKEKNCSVIVLSNSAMDVDFVGITLLNYLQQ